ncbi:MAG: hypothetical protein JWO13_1245 [Acidobacteriales bacterium]|nr:hypothetical protein [Terriglobales bacterium]
MAAATSGSAADNERDMRLVDIGKNFTTLVASRHKYALYSAMRVEYAAPNS